MAKYETKIDDDVRDVLERSTFGRGMITLPEQLQRPMYERGNKVLLAAGAKWDRRAEGHVFPGGKDPRVVLGLALEKGAIIDEKKAKQQFFTPEALAADLVARANVRPGDMVLEPSAGQGAIARELAVAGAIVTCVELDPELAAFLATLGFTAIVGDFLAQTPMQAFDKVVMNPPFTAGQDIDHVLHAFKFLKPGGVLVGVMGGGIQTNQTKKGKAFRAALAVGGLGQIDNLADGSFEESGTGVRTVVVTWRKPNL